MSDRLKDKVAIITGAAKGIGFATAQRFAQEGAKVIITDINQEAVNGATAQTANAEGYAMNVTDRASIQSVVDQVMQKHGRIDILINNAGITQDARLIKMTEAQFDTVIDVNLKGVFNCTQLIVPHMLEAGAGAVVGRPARPARHRDCAARTRSTARRWVIVMIQVVAAPFEASKRGAFCHTSRNTSCITSSDCA